MLGPRKTYWNGEQSLGTLSRRINGDTKSVSSNRRPFVILKGPASGFNYIERHSGMRSTKIDTSESLALYSVIVQYVPNLNKRQRYFAACDNRGWSRGFQKLNANGGLTLCSGTHFPVEGTEIRKLLFPNTSMTLQTVGR